MYTNGIRKIFISKSAIHYIDAQNQAEQCGYKALLWNGQIHIQVDKNYWVLTDFTINDFQTTQEI